MSLEDYMRQALQRKASDLILVVGKPACLYVHGHMEPLDESIIKPPDMQAVIEQYLTDAQRQTLADTGDVDFSISVQGLGRSRVNIHKQRGSYAAAIRFVQTHIPSLADLALPEKLKQLADLPRGLVLVTGATGAGKSTTLAAMIEYMNANSNRHIITLEDPIEYLFSHNRCVIEQREIGEDSPSFDKALRHVVRQKPDVILVGEMRDRETIATALTASETGHLVLGTLHTNSAAMTIERIIDVFEPGHQTQIRVQLANTLQAVFCQSLLRRTDGKGVVPAIEILSMTPAIRRAIRDGDTHLIPGMIETGQKFGMITMDHSLARLVAAGTVTAEEAFSKAIEPEKLQKLLANPAALKVAAAKPNDLEIMEPEFISKW